MIDWPSFFIGLGCGVALCALLAFLIFKAIVRAG